MPFQLETSIKEIRCDWCKQIIKNKPIVVKTCCNNKPVIFCSNKCYTEWMREWLKKQEQMKQRTIKQKRSL